MTRFAMVPEDVVECGPPAVAVYVALDVLADKGGRCWPSVAYLADRTGQAERTVRRALDALQTAGWLAVERRRFDKSGARLSNLYTLPFRTGGLGTNVPLPGVRDGRTLRASPTGMTHSASTADGPGGPLPSAQTSTPEDLTYEAWRASGSTLQLVPWRKQMMGDSK